MRVCNLGSGSDGNLTYIQTDNAKVLVDAGFCASEIQARLSLLKVTPEEIDAILITHEHSDHIKGLDVFARKYGTKVYVHEKGFEAVYKKMRKPDKISFIIFEDNDFYINDLLVKNFKVNHDSAYCSGYSFIEESKKVSIVTDCGVATEKILGSIRGSTLVYLEANHDVQMLKQNPNYPATLKQRILGSRGHLSNDSASKVAEYLAQNGTKQIMLAHLSQENNTPQLAYKCICEYLKSKNIIEGRDINISVTNEFPSNIFNIK